MSHYEETGQDRWCRRRGRRARLGDAGPIHLGRDVTRARAADVPHRSEPGSKSPASTSSRASGRCSPERLKSGRHRQPRRSWPLPPPTRSPRRQVSAAARARSWIEQAQIDRLTGAISRTLPRVLGELLEGEPSLSSGSVAGLALPDTGAPSGRHDEPPATASVAARGAAVAVRGRDRSSSADEGRTRKWLFRAPDGAAIESVLMGYPRRATLCISSQAGCALGCTFCATGQFGFERHLEAGEIVAQVAYAQAFLRQIGMPGVPDHLTNVVFMGMGEPLGQLRPGAGSDPAHDRGDGALGPVDNRLHGGHRPGHQNASPTSRGRSTSRSACTPPTTSCAAAWCRSTADTRSTSSRRPRRSTSRRSAAGCRSSGP